ncbi:aspartate/glutamate racemase family protein [Pseudooceanicola sp. LIPI14-2-Ac024]|uniref:aspartate/glutamate racemase family protein n=1 Tax=Pseudooceanicola sp. LIPI14-2-Ac024 TaxID=3344875 RepID=UPI0035D08C29
MRILFINPNASAEMTESIAASARAVLPGAEVLGWTNSDGPPAIQGPADGDAAVPGLLALLPAAAEAGADVIVIACFDDTGLDLARARAHCPVIGIGQAAYHMAALMGARFAVLTTLAVSVPVIEGNIRALGFAGACATVRPSGLGVLEVEAGSPATMAHLAAELDALDDGNAGAVVLGCAGMSAHLETLQAGTRLTLVDGVRAAAGLAAALVLAAPRAA